MSQEYGADPQASTLSRSPPSTPNNESSCCSMCRSTLTKIFRIYLYVTHYTKWTELIDSADSGCPLCIQLMDGLLGDQRDELLNAMKEKPEMNNLSIHFQRSTSGYVFYVKTTAAKYWAMCFKGNQSSERNGCYDAPSVSTDSDKTFDTVNTWLSTCSQGHEACGGPRDFSWMPTRLLDVTIRQSLDRSKDRVCLDVIDDGRPPAAYATLSHCWGGHTSIMLTDETRRSLEHGYPVEALPKSFSDAVRITRKLGIRYLWIDSLCIQQDSEEDWRRESRVMDMVYSHSWCNIAASSAENASIGCFFTRDPRNVQPFEADVWWDEIKASTSFTFLRDDLWKTHVDKGALAKRGWVVQERALAPRQINFSKAGVFWECRTLKAVDYLPRQPYDYAFFESPNPKRLSYHLEKLTKQTLSIHVDDIPATFKDSVYTEWCRILEIYSATTLTKKRDRLVAISGLAKRVQAAVKDVYLAGLWESRLLTDMCWFKEDESQAPRPRPLLAPTWSWASTLSSIYISYLPRDANTLGNKIVEVKLDHATEDPTGGVVGGHLRLRVMVGLIPRRTQSFYDVEISGPLRALIGTVDLWWDEKSDEMGLGDSCTCIILFTSREIGTRGLLLRALDEGGHYERIGYWSNHISIDVESKHNNLSEEKRNSCTRKL